MPGLESGYIVSFGGLFGNKIYKGEQLVPIIRDKETLLELQTQQSIILQNTQMQENVSVYLQRNGEEAFKKVIQDAYEGK